MHHSSAITLCLSIIFSLLFIQSCEDYSNAGIEESVEFIESTVPIEEAQNVTMDLSSGVNNFALHRIELSNIKPNSVISNGVKKSWCIEWDVSSIQGIQHGVKLHSTEGKAYWSKLNYLLNQIDSLKESYPQLTYKEIQVVIWSIVDYKPFEIDEIPNYQNFPGNFCKDGEYLFDVSLAKEILQLVNSRSENSASEHFAIVIENEGQIIITSSE